MTNKTSPIPRGIVGYYGMLQLAHLAALIRASAIYLQSGSLPFPASPPSGGWSPQVVPFLLGLGAVDVLAILLGIYFAARTLVGGRDVRQLGLLSLTIAFPSALVFAVGTITAGAWAAYPLEYGLMVVLFTPLLPLYVTLLNPGQQ